MSITTPGSHHQRHSPQEPNCCVINGLGKDNWCLRGPSAKDGEALSAVHKHVVIKNCRPRALAGASYQVLHRYGSTMLKHLLLLTRTWHKVQWWKIVNNKRIS